MGKVGIERTIA